MDTISHHGGDYESGDAIGGLLLGFLLGGSLLRLFGSRFLLVLSVGRLWCGKVEEMVGGTQYLKLCSSVEGIAFTPDEEIGRASCRERV